MSDPVREALVWLAERLDHHIALDALDREREDRYLAGWRAGRDAAMKAVYNEAYRKPQSPALGPEIEWLKAADLIRTLPDPPME